MKDHSLDELIKKAVEENEEPDFDRMWSRIDHTIKVAEKQQIKPKRNIYQKTWFKFAAVFSVIFIICLIIGSTAKTGETFPFLYPLHRFVQQVVTSTHSLLSFDLKKEQNIPDDITKYPPEFIETPAQVDFTDADLEALISIYPGVLYYPGIIPLESIKKIQYKYYDYFWTIIMDINYEGFDIMLIQEDYPKGGVIGQGYDREDARLSFYRSGGVEYMVVEDRYNIVKITWFMEDKLFILSTNIPVDTAKEIAQSVKRL